MAIQRIRPISFSSSSRRGSTSVLGYSDWPKRKSLTAQQQFEVAMAQKMERHSFLDKIKHAGSVAFTPVEYTLDKLMRPNYAIAEAFRAATEAPGQQKLLEIDPGKFAHGLREGFMGRKKTTFGQVLEQEGVLKGHRKLRGLAGSVYDVGLDPTTYLSLGTTAVARTGGQAAHKAGRKIIQGGVEDIDELKGLRKTLEEAGEPYKFRAAFAKERERITLKADVDSADYARVAQARSAAWREEFKHSKHLPKLKLGILKTPTHIGGKRVVPALPRPVTALRAKKIPGVSSFVGGMRTAIGSQVDDVMRGLRVTEKHTVEQLSDEYLGTINKLIKGMPKLKKQRMLNVLHHFEKPGGVEKVVSKDGNVDFVLSESRMQELKAKGLIDEKDEKFVRMWHDVAQYMHRTDESFGIKYTHMGEGGKLYVPHLVDRSGVPYSKAEKNMMKQAGYTKGRQRGDMTLAMIDTAVKNGQFSREVETDPYRLLVTMARTRAHQHADKAALDFLAHGVGVPSRIVGPQQRKKIEANEKAMAEIEEKLLKFDSPSKKNLKQYTTMMSKLDELANETKKLKKGKSNKKNTAGMVDTLNVKDEFGNTITFEPEIAAAMTRVEKILDPTEDIAVQKFAKAIAGAQGRWKLWATAVNPGYRFRNTMSDYWNMYVAGVPFWAMTRYSGRAAKVMKDAKNGDPTALGIMEEAYHQGVLSGLFGGDIGTLARAMQYQGSKTALAKRGRFLKLGVKAMTDINRNAENFGRMTHYLYRREYEKMGVTDAAMEVKKAHFDYEDLTEFERRYIKGVFIPFYTWTRKNVPFQIKALFTQPGKYAAFPKLAIESEYAAGDAEGDLLPDYLSENFSFKIPFGKDAYFTPPIGASDLSRYQTPSLALKNAGMMVSPFFKVPAELLTNKNLMTGAPIQGDHPRTPISEAAAPFLDLIPGMNVGPTQRSGVSGMGANPKAVHAITSFGGGWARFGVTGGSKIKSAQRGFGPGWSQGLGLTLTELNREQQLLIDRMELQEKLKKKLRGLRDEKKYPEPEDQSSAYEEQIKRQIAFQLGR